MRVHRSCSDIEGKNIEVSGTVKKVDGVKFLEVKSYKIL